MTIWGENVVPFPGITTLDTNPSNVLAFANAEQFTRVIVIGVLVDGSEYVASSVADGSVFLWDIERAKHKLMLKADSLADE